MNIISYSQTDESMALVIDGIKDYNHEVKVLENVPSTIDVNSICSAQSVCCKRINKSNEAISFILNLDDISESAHHEYSIFMIFMGRCKSSKSETSEIQYIELVRQSSVFLNKTFGFNRAGGYTILGRRSQNFFISKVSKYHKSKPMIFYGRDQVPKKFPDEMNLSTICEYDELIVCKRILEYLVSLPINTGPYLRNHRMFSLSSFTKRIKMLLKGDYAIQCTGFRDLFAWLCTSAGLKVRAIDANNAKPEFNDLITYGHSLCEIYIKNLKKYVIVDPWFGGALVIGELRNSVGVPLSSKELMQRNEDSELKLRTLIESYERYIIVSTKHKAQSRYLYHFQASNLSLTDYYFNEEIGSCMPGYFEYFNQIVVKNVVIYPRVFKIPAYVLKLVVHNTKKFKKYMYKHD